MKILVGIILFAVGLPITIIALVKCASNLLKIWSHVKQEALNTSAFLRFNRFNAVFVPNALDEEGIKARGNLAKYALILIVTVTIVMSYGIWSGLAAT